ncbi:unnamed protein product [Microthlaspi erraticum]|uniref:Uncharacterized protein n=1 Tax=Microthlaspi erraticum TaxID=1685480 RepID=A0A6D2HYK1_9BRAS|nr:unnamed protein product [Microthlaspi erraticum]
MMAGNLWRTWPYQQSAMENTMKYRRSSTAHSIELDAQMRKDMLALKSKLDKLILAQFPAKHVNYVSEKVLVKGQDGEETTHEVCYTQNRQGSYRNPQQGRYNSYPAPWPHQQLSVPQCFNQRTTHTQPNQDWDMKEMLQQLLQGQAKGSLEMNNKLVEINSKLESLTSRVQMIYL